MRINSSPRLSVIHFSPRTTSVAYASPERLESGQVELSVTPYGHPILPLLIASMAAFALAWVKFPFRDTIFLWQSILLAVLGAMLLLWIYRMATRSRGTHTV